jgi:hypothetical protein
MDHDQYPLRKANVISSIKPIQAVKHLPTKGISNLCFVIKHDNQNKDQKSDIIPPYTQNGGLIRPLVNAKGIGMGAIPAPPRD